MEAEFVFLVRVGSAKWAALGAHFGFAAGVLGVGCGPHLVIPGEGQGFSRMGCHY